MNNERMIAVSSDLIERAISLLDLHPESGTIIELRAALAAQPAGGEPVAWRYRTHGNGPWYVTTNLIHARVFEGTEDGGQVQGLFAVAPPAAAHGDDAPGTVRVTADWLKTVHRDLDACQKVIWLAGCRPRVPGGFDPAYCEDAQARLKEIDEHIARAQSDGETRHG